MSGYLLHIIKFRGIICSKKPIWKNCLNMENCPFSAFVWWCAAGSILSYKMRRASSLFSGLNIYIYIYVSAKFTLNSKRFPRLKSTFSL